MSAAITPVSARAAVSEVLANPTYRHQAERIRDEATALSAPAHAVSLLDRLATEKRPWFPPESQAPTPAGCYEATGRVRMAGRSIIGCYVRTGCSQSTRYE